MFGTTTPTAAAVFADLGEISGEIFPDLLPYIYVALGIPLAFVIGRYIIGLFKAGFGRSRTS